MKALIAGMLLLGAAAGPLGAATLERRFHYPSERIATVWSGDTVQVAVANGTAESVPGRPDLPFVAEPIEVPVGMRVVGVRARRTSLEPLAPAARVRVVPADDRGLDPLGRPRTGPLARLGDPPGAASEPPPMVELGYQGSMRGRNLAYLLVRPVRWDPASGRLDRLADLDVEVQIEPDPGAGVVRRERVVPEWEERSGPSAMTTTASLPKGGAQPFKPTQLPSVLGSPVAYVIVTSDALAPEFQRLADWKTQTGVPAVVRTLSLIRQQYDGTDDADRIRRFLRDAYARWGAKWALLGGDTDVIPTRVAWTTFYTFGGPLNDIPTDLYFSCLDGNWNADGDSLYGEGDLSPTILGDGCDLLPEIWVGRAPVSTLAEAQRFVDKTFQYLRTPVGDYERNLLFFAEVLDPQDWNPGDFVVLDGAALVEECLPYVKSNASALYTRLYENDLEPSYEPGALPLSRHAVLTRLDQGYNLAVHNGHGFRNVLSAGDSSITNADAQTMTNGNRLTNFYAVNCTSNAIDYPCLGEALMKAANGGAVTNIGSTRLDFPGTGRAYQKEFFRLLFQDSVSAMGEAQGRQKLGYVASARYDNTHRWTQMTMLLLGDPELRMWTGTPRTLAVTRPASMAASETTLAVHVAIGPDPLMGARVTAYKAGDDYASALTDGAGNVTLDFRPDGSGSLTLTVTGYDCVPYQATVPVTAATGVLLVEGAVTVDDDNLGGTIGNGDGVLDAGETADLTVPVRNAGGVTSFGVTGTLSSGDPLVTILTPGVSYGTVLPSATVNGAKFRISTSAAAPDQAELAFQLSIVDAAARHFVEPLRLTLHAPELTSYAHTVVESPGDGDGRPEPGESVTYTVSLRNGGSGKAPGVTAVLRCYDGLVTITDSTATVGDVAPGATATGDGFAFSVGSAAAVLELRVSTARGLLATQRLDLGWPAAPLDLASRGYVSSVRLTWAANGEPDLRGYNVYRSPSQGGPYDKISAVPADRVAYWVDEGLTPLTRYYYEVSAVDGSGNESALSAPTSVSTSPPNHTVFPIAMAGNARSSVAVARIYQPGKMDIIAGADHLHVWHADGTSPVDADGTSVTSGDFTTEGSYYAAGASVADLDGGSLEIVAPTWNDQKMFVFDLQGQVKPGWPFTAAAPIWSMAAIGDLDKDGSKEIVFASNSTQFYVLRANGAEWMDGDANPSTQGVFKVLGHVYNYGTPALADLDRDGTLDIVYSSFDGFLYAWRSNGADLPGFPINLGGNSCGSVAIGYLDGPGDNQLEIVAGSGGLDDSLYVFEANGARRPGFPVAYRTYGVYGKHPSPALADMNGDGYLDIVVGGVDGRLYVYDGNGALFPAFANVRYSALTSEASESSPVVADIDGDGSPDIVMGDDLATLSAFDNAGHLLPGFPIALGGEAKGTPALCDCDGDGMTEIALASWDGELSLWDYDFPFSPNVQPPWPMLNHDVMRTGFASAETAVTVPPGALPAYLRLSPPVPNPARAGASLSYDVPASEAGRAFSVQVYDPAGRLVRRLEHGTASAGRFSLFWNLKDADGGLVSSGLYLISLEVGGQRRTSRVVVLP